MQKLIIVIPVYNRKDLLRKCLFSFNKQTFRNFKIIVVDDGSTDGTGEMLSKEFPEVIILTGDGNLWWTGAINKGIRYALKMTTDSDYILVTNDDLEVRDDYLQILMDLTLVNKSTLIGSIEVDILDPDIIVYGGELLNPWTAKRRLINKGQKLSAFEPNKIVEVSRLYGRGTLIPVKVFNDIGLYDEKHFKQCGDVELTGRAKNRGYRLIMSYSAIILSHIKETDKLNINQEYRLRDIRRVFFNIRSYNNLNYIFYDCWNTSTNLVQFAVFFIFSFSRKFVRFMLKVRSF
jgi:N-acetylglucosaminyl-diphospho-decaprenol L-rhamnosyltransferase